MNLTRNRLCGFLVVALIVALATSGSASVVVSTFDHSDDGLASGNGADTWIVELEPDTNRGAARDMRLRDRPDNQQEYLYVRFDLSAIDTSQWDNALFQLYDYRFSEGNLMNGRAFHVWALTDEAQDGWNESGAGGITWNGAPGHLDDGIALDDADFDGNAVFLDSITFLNQSSLSGSLTSGWNVPTEVSGLWDYIRQDTNDQITLMITAPVGVGSLFYAGTKETVQDRRIVGALGEPINAVPLGSLAPRLTFVPEPSAVLLLLLGVCLVVPARRRRDR